MRLGRAIAVVGSAGILLSACAIPSGSPNPTPSPTSTIDATAFTDLAAGSCYDPIDVASVETIDCAKPHRFEVFASFVLPDSEYPGDTLDATASQQCRTAFSAFIGIDFDASALSLRYIGPSRATWAEGDREVLCVAFDPDGATTGSLANTAD